jgi:hypothetical protein
LLEKPKRRKDITRTFCHFKHLDMSYAIRVPSTHRLTPELSKLLKSRGAPDSCYAISEDDELDGKEVLLLDALALIRGRGIGTFLSCIPGKLAYFEDEDQRWILERKPKA